jgi:hypothetical protein
MRHKIYKLEGKSLIAARKLETLVEAAYAAEKISLSGKNLAEIRLAATNFHRNLAGNLLKQAPTVMRAAGLTKPHIIVRNEPGALPRAYETYPEIHVSPFKSRDYYMFVPVDYKGHTFVPEGAKLLNKKETNAVHDLLFAGGWSDSAPLLYRPDRGTKTPCDYYPPRGKVPETKEKIFIAAGRSLEYVKDFIDHKKRHEKAVNDAFNALDEAYNIVVKESGASEKVYVNKSMSNAVSRLDQGLPAIKPVFTASARQAGSGSPVVIPELKDNRFFKVTEQKHGDDVIATRTDTPEGSALHKKLDAVGIRPDIAAYWALKNPTAPKVKDKFAQALGVDYGVPKLESNGGVHYLIYKIGKTGKDHCNPPDSIPVSTAEYLWAKADAEDRARGIYPPPPPAQLAHLEPVKPVRKPSL